MHENEEVLMENVSPEDLPAANNPEERPFTPSPRWKRILAWVLFAIVILGLGCWLTSIAFPNWVETVKAFFAS